MHPSEHVEHATVLMMQAELAHGEARRDLLDEATDVLLRAERVDPGIGAWQLACIHARQDNRELCERWLVRAHKNGLLPKREEILASPYFADTRIRAWVRRIIDKL